MTPEFLLKKAEAFYSCAEDLDVQVRKFTEARDICRKFGDQFSEAASFASSPPPSKEQP